jgi:hypothetical protein
MVAYNCMKMLCAQLCSTDSGVEWISATAPSCSVHSSARLPVLWSAGLQLYQDALCSSLLWRAATAPRCSTYISAVEAYNCMRMLCAQLHRQWCGVDTCNCTKMLCAQLWSTDSGVEWRPATAPNCTPLVARQWCGVKACNYMKMLCAQRWTDSGVDSVHISARQTVEGSPATASRCSVYSSARVATAATM